MPNPETDVGLPSVIIVDVSGLNCVLEATNYLASNADYSKAVGITEKFHRVLEEENADNATTVFSAALWGAAVAVSTAETLGGDASMGEKLTFSLMMLFHMTRTLAEDMLKGKERRKRRGEEKGGGDVVEVEEGKEGGKAS